MYQKQERLGAARTAPTAFDCALRELSCGLQGPYLLLHTCVVDREKFCCCGQLGYVWRLLKRLLSRFKHSTSGADPFASVELM